MRVRSTRRRRSIVVAAGLAAALVAGCSAGSGAAGSGASGDPSVIRIGLLSTLDGPFEPLGIAANQGAKLALLEAGGSLTGTGPLDTVTGATVAGKPIELTMAGSNNVSPDIAVNAARRLVEEDDVDVIVGPTSGDEGLAVKNYIASVPDVTLVNGTAAAQNMTLRDPVPNVFRFSTDGAQWMAGLGTYTVEELGYDRVATVAEDYSYPYDQVGGFLTEFCAAGGEVSQRIWMPLGTNDFASYIAELTKDREIDAVYVALGGTDAVNFIRQFDEFTGRPLPIVAGSLTVDPAIIRELGPRVEGVVSAGPVAVLDTPEYREYAAALKRHYPESAPPGFADVLYYVAMKAVLRALEESGGDVAGDQAAFRQVLAGQSFDTPQGPVKLDDNRQVIANNYLFKVTNGQSTLLREIPAVTQTLGRNAKAYTAEAAFDRSNPTCGPDPAPSRGGAPAASSTGGSQTTPPTTGTRPARSNG
jgi:branched-chain amino acid transport system substrate-binding protein